MNIAVVLCSCLVVLINSGGQVNSAQIDLMDLAANHYGHYVSTGHDIRPLYNGNRYRRSTVDYLGVDNEENQQPFKVILPPIKHDNRRPCNIVCIRAPCLCPHSKFRKGK